MQPPQTPQPSPALRDRVTGLPSRAFFCERLERALAGEHGSPALLVVDLDRFAIVNESLGRQAGDELLHSAARRLERALPAGCTLAHVHADEFAVLCEGVGGERDAVEAAERLLAALRAPFAVDDEELYVSASIGIALAVGTVDADELTTAASVAMSRAKDGGGGRYEIYDERLRRRAAERVRLETALRRAIDADELTLFYQPLVDLADGSIVGMEALVRWEHPERGLVPPSAFIPLAEECGLIVPLSRWVLGEACRQIVRWDADPSIELPYVSVNLSGRHLAEPGLPEEIADLLARTGVPPERLAVELTESVLMEGTAAPIAVVQRIKALGVRVLLDDFGTGYSSLSYLKSFPIDALKLDRAFVAGIADDGPDRHIVRSVVGLAQALGLDVIAEGVESPDDARWLARAGCGLAQGYAFARPAPAEAAGALLRDGLPAARRPVYAAELGAEPAFASPSAPRPAPVADHRTVTVGEAADALGVSATTLRRWEREGRVRAARTTGGHRRFAVAEIRGLTAAATAVSAAVRTRRLPAETLPALAALLDERGDEIVAASARALYEGPRQGWFGSEAARTSLHHWSLALQGACGDGHYAPAVEATRRLAERADCAGSSVLERHGFLERFAEFALRLLQDRGATHAELVASRSLLARLREAALEACG